MKTLEQFESLKNNGRPFVKVLPCIFNHFHVLHVGLFSYLLLTRSSRKHAQGALHIMYDFGACRDNITGCSIGIGLLLSSSARVLLTLFNLGWGGGFDAAPTLNSSQFQTISDYLFFKFIWKLGGVVEFWLWGLMLPWQQH